MEFFKFLRKLKEEEDEEEKKICCQKKALCLGTAGPRGSRAIGYVWWETAALEGRVCSTQTWGTCCTLFMASVSWFSLCRFAWFSQSEKFRLKGHWRCFNQWLWFHFDTSLFFFYIWTRTKINLKQAIPEIKMQKHKDTWGSKRNATHGKVPIKVQTKNMSSIQTQCEKK